MPETPSTVKFQGIYLCVIFYKYESVMYDNESVMYDNELVMYDNESVMNNNESVLFNSESVEYNTDIVYYYFFINLSDSYKILVSGRCFVMQQ